ncbi:MAG: hypothetical protein ACK5MT_02710 [Actinomycetales bacterium]
MTSADATGPAAAHTPDLLARLAGLDGVEAAVEAARTACEELRWHPAMRRRSAQVRAEAGVWQAWASARLEGAVLPVEAFRAAGVGARPLPSDPVGKVAAGALRAGALADQLAADGGRVLRSAPAQALARLHLAAAQGLVAADDVGRPRSEPGVTVRLGRVRELLAGTTQAPAVVLAAIVQAEIHTMQPFVGSNAVVARALGRAVTIGWGLDPMGAAVPDVVLAEDPSALAQAAQGYAEGGSAGVAAWLCFYADAVAQGARRGADLAGSVISGRPLRA